MRRQTDEAVSIEAKIATDAAMDGRATAAVIVTAVRKEGNAVARQTIGGYIRQTHVGRRPIEWLTSSGWRVPGNIVDRTAL